MTNLAAEPLNFVDDALISKLGLPACAQTRGSSSTAILQLENMSTCFRRSNQRWHVLASVGWICTAPEGESKSMRAQIVYTQDSLVLHSHQVWNQSAQDASARNSANFKSVHTAKTTIAEGGACNLLACHAQRNESMSQESLSIVDHLRLELLRCDEPTGSTARGQRKTWCRARHFPKASGGVGMQPPRLPRSTLPERTGC